MQTREEHDSMGVVRVPVDALWGAQTQRAVENFPVGGGPMPAGFVHALGAIKGAVARAHGSLGLLPEDVVTAVALAADEVADGEHDAHFPVDVFQTGSGTSSNMNANEVIARLASMRLGAEVHPNDVVNRGQSSNDVVPSAIHVAASVALSAELLPATAHLARTLRDRAEDLAGVVKTGRTHLMDAMPVRLDQELGGWASQIEAARDGLVALLPRTTELALGGTAVGTGVNADPRLAALACANLARRTGLDFRPAADRFAALSSQDTAVALSGQLKVLAVALTKIANDLRWMNSGPLAGLGEIALPALQPGSSIMPGKVNPVIPEAVVMVAAQVIGNDATITVAGQAGNFQLNVMLPVVAKNLLESIGLLASASRLLADRAVAGFTVNHDRLDAALARNPILVTALNPVIGYDKGAAIAKRAYAEGRPVLDVAREETDLSEAELRRLLDPAALTRTGA